MVMDNDIFNHSYSGKQIGAIYLLICIAIGGASGLIACKRQSSKIIVANSSKDSGGEATFTTLVDSASGRRALPKNQSYQWPRAKGALTMPIYPEAALKNKFGAAKVAVRIVVGVEGKVTEISDSPLMTSSQGPFASEFRAATEEAIRNWSFEPAEIHTLEDGKDLDGDGKPDYKTIIATQKVPVYFDLHFNFNIIEKDGQIKQTVTTSSSKKPDGASKVKEKTKTSTKSN
jgi:hypothetical protein